MAAFESHLPTISVLLTALLALSGWLVTHRHARQLARRKDRLDLITKRLNEFYGPLYVVTKAGAIAYQALLKKLGHEGDIFGEVRWTPRLRQSVNPHLAVR
jgi:peptidoglycan/LPS O-acetylase OafA/YrhL